MSAPFTYRAGVSLRHLPNKFVGLRTTRRFNDFFVSRIRAAIGNIFAHCCGKEQCVLQHDGDLRPQGFFCDLTHIAAIEHHGPGCRIVKTRHKTEQCALTGAGAACQPNDLIRFDAEIDVP